MGGIVRSSMDFLSKGRLGCRMRSGLCWECQKKPRGTIPFVLAHTASSMLQPCSQMGYSNPRVSDQGVERVAQSLLGRLLVVTHSQVDPYMSHRQNSRCLEYVFGGYQFSKSEESCGKRWGASQKPCPALVGINKLLNRGGSEENQAETNM